MVKVNNKHKNKGLVFQSRKFLGNPIRPMDLSPHIRKLCLGK